MECWRGRHLFGIGSILTRIRKRILQYNGFFCILTTNAVSIITYPKCRFFCWWDESWRWQWKALSHTLHVKDSSVNGITKWNENKPRRLHVVYMDVVRLWSKDSKNSLQFLWQFFFSRVWHRQQQIQQKKEDIKLFPMWTL